MTLALPRCSRASPNSTPRFRRRRRQTPRSPLSKVDDYAALKWARGELADRPAPDIAQRDRLAREADAARASAASATRAKATLEAQVTAEQSKIPDMARFADATIVEVLSETAGPIVESLKAEAIEIAAKIKSLETVSGMALAMAEKGRVVQPISIMDAELATLGVAIQRPEPVNPTPPEALRAACLSNSVSAIGLGRYSTFATAARVCRIRR